MIEWGEEGRGGERREEERGWGSEDGGGRRRGRGNFGVMLFLSGCICLFAMWYLLSSHSHALSLSLSLSSSPFLSPRFENAKENGFHEDFDLPFEVVLQSDDRDCGEREGSVSIHKCMYCTIK